jgi:uncharacterized protein with HEPN domain
MPRDEQRLRDIVEAAAKIAKYIEGASKQQFLATEMLQDAVLLQVICIGEAASRVSDALRSRNPQVEWDKIRAARNRAVHDYAGIDWEIVWVTASEAIPELARTIEAILPEQSAGADQ